MQLVADLQKKSGHCNLWIPGGVRFTAVAEAKDLCGENFSWEVFKLIRSRSSRIKLENLAPTTFAFARSCMCIRSATTERYPFGMQMCGLKRIVRVHLEVEKEVLRWAFRGLSEVIMTCARFLADYGRSILPEERQRTQKVVSVPNAIDISRFYPGDKQIGRALSETCSFPTLVTKSHSPFDE